MSMRYYPAPGEDVRAAALSEALRYLEGDFEAQPADVVAAMCRTALAAQPAPEVPAGAEVAEVLAKLVALYEKSLEPNSWAVCEYNYGARNTSWESDWEDAFAAAQRQAATGARAAGGDDVHGGYTCAEVERFCDDAQGDLNTIGETLARRGYKVNCREHDVVHWVREALNAAAPPAPVAPGVAALLAICEQRQKSTFVAVVSCDEIVRLLAPGGADGGQS